MPSQASVTVGGKITAAITNTTIGNANGQGTSRVVPTSVAGTGVAVGTNGVVTFAAATTVSVNGCFTSTYDNYLIVFNLTTSGVAALSPVLRLSGTDAVTSYDTQRQRATSTTADAAQSLNAVSWIGSGGGGGAGFQHVGTIQLFGPALAVATTGLIQNGLTPNPMTTSATLYNGLLLHRTAAAYDGFSFPFSAGTATGTIRIYGYNNN